MFCLTVKGKCVTDTVTVNESKQSKAPTKSQFIQIHKSAVILFFRGKRQCLASILQAV